MDRIRKKKEKFLYRAFDNILLFSQISVLQLWKEGTRGYKNNCKAK